MHDDQILLTRPPGCCDECIEHAAVSHESMIAVYCKHTQTGAWMRKNQGDLLGRWTALAPIPAEDFAAFLEQLISDCTIFSRQIM